MSERRMFAKTIIDSDAFLDMPLSTQALYFHLSMRADDEGFVNNPKKIQRMIGASDDDMKVLGAKRFILSFESGVIVIKHWKIHNYIRGDRLQATTYQTERELLDVKENGAYTFKQDMVAICQTSDSQVTDMCPSSVSIGKDRLSSIDKDSVEETPKRKTKKAQAEKQRYGVHNNVLLTEEEYIRLQCEYGARANEAIQFLDDYLVEKPNYKSASHNMAIRRWVFDALNEREEKRRRSSGVTKSAQAYNNYQQRDYSQEDMNEIERKMLEKSYGGAV